MKKIQPYDVIIVGGGLAGLSAACALDGALRVLLLENKNRLGGKVDSTQHGDFSFETGALFAFDPDWVPFPVDGGPLEKNGCSIGLFYDGVLHTGQTVTQCLQSLGPELRQWLNIGHFLNASRPQTETIGKKLYQSLNGFFQVIHPGNMEAYVAARRADSLLRHTANAYAEGNGALIRTMAEYCSADIQTGAPVTRMHHDADRQLVQVSWQKQGERQQTSWAKRVILSVPARQAHELCRACLPEENMGSRFPGAVRYGPGIVIVLGCRNVDWPSLSYVVSPQGRINTFFFRIPERQPDTTVITAYLVGEKAFENWEKDDRQLQDICIGELNLLQPDLPCSADFSLLAVKRLSEVGPIISPQAYKHFCTSRLCPMPGVILAGDYTWWDQHQMPYGMWAAIASGRRAVQLCRRGNMLPVKKDFCASPLAQTAISRISDNGPVFVENITDGTIAYYGLLLQVAQDPDLEQYLLNESVDDLWGYQQEYGVTSLDSALVMEGLLASRKHQDQLNRSCRKLVDLFYDQKVGGFWTIDGKRSGRAPYWQGVDCPATAACAWLLSQIDPKKYERQIQQCFLYLRAKQQISGGWPGKWFPSRTIPIWYTVRFFRQLIKSGRDDKDLTDACQRAVQYLKGTQKDNGSWNHSVIETSAALLALNLEEVGDPAAEAGRSWILSRKGPGGWQGEPILEYWFEEKGERTMYFTRDKGRITSAWATLALHSFSCHGDL